MGESFRMKTYQDATYRSEVSSGFDLQNTEDDVQTPNRNNEIDIQILNENVVCDDENQTGYELVVIQHKIPTCDTSSCVETTV